jgi:DNA processing protein
MQTSLGNAYEVSSYSYPIGGSRWHARAMKAESGDEPALFVQMDASVVPLGDLAAAESLAALMLLPRIGAKRAIRLAETFGSWERLLEAPVESVRAASGVAVEVRRLSIGPVPAGVRVVGWFDTDYPPAYKRLVDPPAVLWVRGNLEPACRRIAIVGTRQPTVWGEQIARLIAQQSVKRGIEVVSGLALGIDIAAHCAALDAGGRTTAILGSGVDTPTPLQHRGIAERILDQGGALVAEVRPGMRPSARTLVARNRLQSGLSAVTLLAQCGLTSGTMYTAKFASQQGKVLAVAVPLDWELGHATNAGNRKLLAASGDSDYRVGFALRSTEQIADLLDLVAT